MRQMTFLFETAKNAAHRCLFEIVLAAKKRTDRFDRTGFDLPHGLHDFVFQVGKGWTHDGASIGRLCHGTSCTTPRNHCQAIFSGLLYSNDSRGAAGHTGSPVEVFPPEFLAHEEERYCPQVCEADPVGLVVTLRYSAAKALSDQELAQQERLTVPKPLRPCRSHRARAG